MMRSLSSGVAGLRAHQTKMDVIGTNIANVNTYGFKNSRVSFSDVYYQTLSSGSAPTTSLGGTNPTQIGYGSAVATIDVMNAQAGMSSTDRALDIYIDGDGMIATKDANGNLLYTRLGVLGFDAEGNLVDSNGNFVMGFPVNKDGVPQIGPDGTLDVEDLSKITVDKEMLDQMTGISIGTTGEIIGTMPGDVEVSFSKKAPPWLENITIKPDTNIVGDVKVTMEYRSTSPSTSGMDWIKEVEALPNSRLDGNYSFSYDEASKTITMTDANNNIYTGTYKKNATVDMTDARGNKVMTIATHEYNVPSNGDSWNMDFDEQLYLRVDYTDKGGNKNFDEIEYNGESGDITLGDITLTVNPDLAGEVSNMTMSYNPGNQFATGGTVAGATPPNYDGWLLGAAIDNASSYADGNIQLAVGMDRNVTLGYNANSHLSFLDSDVIKQIIGDTDAVGKYTISVEQVNATNPSAGIKYVITPPGGGATIESAPVTATSRDVIFPGGLNAGTVPANQFKGTTVSNTQGLLSAKLQEAMAALGQFGDYNLTVTPNGGNYDIQLAHSSGTPTVTAANVAVGADIEFNIGGNLYNIGALSNGVVTAFGGAGDKIGNYGYAQTVKNASLGEIKDKKTIKLIDSNNSILAETTYNGNSTVKLGDMTIRVDRDNLNAFFEKRPKLDDFTVSIGSLTRETEDDLLFENNAANAQVAAGESVVVGVIALAKVPNVFAMAQSGNSYFTTTANSGEASFVRPGLNNSGLLVAGYLEMSNVDVSKEFTEMITTQRGFQANTRIITVSDEMLNELVNLKR